MAVARNASVRPGKMIQRTGLKKPTAYFLLDKLPAAGWISESAEQAGTVPRVACLQFRPRAKSPSTGYCPPI